MRFRSDQLIKVMETSEMVEAGTLSFSDAYQLAHMRSVLYKHGSESGPESLRMQLYYANGTLHSQSEWARIHDIGVPDSSWFGWIRFDFPGNPWVHNGLELACKIESANYTRSGDAFYLGFALDFGMASHSSPNALALEVYGYSVAKVEG